ncbi:MAG: hypothetical protein AAFR45_03070 [Pseudomonadota bacterium]
MRGIVVLWAVLAGLNGVFTLWHYSWKGPLTAEEIDTQLARLLEDFGRQSLEGETLSSGSEQHIIEFLRADDGRPFFMLNLMEFRETAAYANGENPDGLSGEEAEALYSRYVIPNLLKRGSYPLIITQRLTTITDTMGTGEAEFERFALVRYRSRRDFLDLISTPAFGEMANHKWAGLSGTLVSPTAVQLTLVPSLFVPVLLIGIGAAGTVLLTWLGRRRGTAPDAKLA